MILPTRYKMKPPPSAKPIKSILKNLGCVGLWVMNENGGLSIFDLSGYGNTGVFGAGAASPSWVVGKFGPALYFDGGDYIDCGAKSSLNITGSLTISAWVKRTTQTYDSVVSKDDSVNRNYQLWIASSGDARPNKAHFLIYRGNIPFQAISDNPLLIDTLYHLVGVHNGTDVLLYVNGVLQITTAIGGTIDNDPVNLWIGDRSDVGVLPVDGKIDNVMICNRASPQSVIDQFYQEPFFMFGRKRTIVTVPAIL